MEIRGGDGVRGVGKTEEPGVGLLLLRRSVLSFIREIGRSGSLLEPYPTIGYIFSCSFGVQVVNEVKV